MKRDVLNYLKQHNLTDTKIVDSLIVSVFLFCNKIEVKNNLLLIKYLTHSFQKKDILMNELLTIVSKHEGTFGFEKLIQLFEFVISPADRIINGAIYTPKIIRNFIIDQTLQQENLEELISCRVADIACGCGAFLYDAAIFLKANTKLTYQAIFEKNLYGLDIEKYSVTRTKLLLSLLAIYNGEDMNFTFNLFVDDALTFDWNNKINNFNGFNFILGNPPYVSSRYLTEKTRELISKKETCQSGNPDLYIPFFEIGINNLSPNGILGYITMNSFFKSLNARNLRQYFQKKSLEFKIIDFGAEQVFQSRNTYTCICLIKNIFSNVIRYTRTAPELLYKVQGIKDIAYSTLDPFNGWNLYANELINKIEKTGTPLGQKYRTSHGLATLKNDIYIFSPTWENEIFYALKTKDDKEYLIEKAICMSVVNSNKLSRKATIQELTEQLIFPYTNEQKPKIISEEVLQKEYPKAYQYLLDHKSTLAMRDKGKGKYQKWYAFGRTQGLEQIQHKMFFPKYSDVIPHYLIHSDAQTYFYNGQAFLASSTRELQLLKKFLETRLFWFYISATSKPYASNYYSLNGTYIRNFGICDLSKEEENFILQETNQKTLNNFFEKKYDIYFT